MNTFTVTVKIEVEAASHANAITRVQNAITDANYRLELVEVINSKINGR